LEAKLMSDFTKVMNKTTNEMFKILDNACKKLENDKDRVNLQISVALNIMGNTGLTLYLPNEEDHQNMVKLGHATSKTLMLVTDWFTDVYQMNKKKGMN